MKSECMIVNFASNPSCMTVQLEINVRPLQRVSPHLTIDLEPSALDALELSVVGTIYNGSRDVAGGQCLEDVRKLSVGHPKAKQIGAICDIWDRWHLNGMQAGTRAQRDALVSMAPAVYPESHYTKACAHLEAVGLLEDRGYRYGSAWLSEPLPEIVVKDIRALVAAMRA